MVSVCISLKTNDVEYLFLCLFAICVAIRYLFSEVSVKTLACFLRSFFVFFLSFKSSPYILNNSLFIRCVFSHFFPSLWLVFLTLSLAQQKVFNFNEPSLPTFFFMGCVFGVVAKYSSVYSLMSFCEFYSFAFYT